MRSRIFFKLLPAFLLVIATATITLDFTIRPAWEDSLLQEIERSLREKALLLAQRVATDKGHSLEEIAREVSSTSRARVTIINKDGKVLADTEADPRTMENHSTRPEFAAALAGKAGSSVRFSHTVHINFLYTAVPTDSGAVRLAYPLADIQKTTARIRRTLLAGSGLAVLVAMLLAAIAAQIVARRLQKIVRFAERVSAGDLSARIEPTSLDEIGQVAAALDRTARQLEASFQEVNTRREQMETLLNSMHEPVLAVDRECVVQWSNGAMQRITGGRSRNGVPAVEVIRDPEFLTAIRKALDSHQPATARSQGTLAGKVFDVTAAPMQEGAVVVLHDLSEIERVEKTRRDFVANVSHELRTPLTSIQGYAETLLDAAQGSASSSREFLEIIRKNAERMARLTEDLLTLARVESGEHKLEFAPVNARGLLEDARNAFSQRSTTRGVELAIAEMTDEIVRADADALMQVFSNLIDNSLKYGESSRIEIGARRGDSEVEFYVRDFGAGIASEHIPRLFERFYRVDKHRSREAGGTGLGLAIVKHIVLNHGGRVRAESELGHGSTFLFSIPLVTAVGEVHALDSRKV